PAPSSGATGNPPLAHPDNPAGRAPTPYLPLQEKRQSLYHSVLIPTGRFLTGHLSRLQASLTTIGGQLPAPVSSPVSWSAAEALRQALARLLRPPGAVQDGLETPSGLEDRSRLGDSYRRETHSRSDWGEPTRLDPWHESGESRWGRRQDSDWRGHN